VQQEAPPPQRLVLEKKLFWLFAILYLFLRLQAEQSFLVVVVVVVVVVDRSRGG
jgi:hypothetical protein